MKFIVNKPPEMKRTAYISMGSNLGDKQENCRRALSVMALDPLIRIDGVSDYYRTEPVGYPDQPWFVNAAVTIATGYSPQNLLGCLQAIESRAGRERGGVRFGPRIIDLDILFYDDLVCENQDLVIPHPRMHERAFVLRPLCDIAPVLVHPVLKKTMHRLLADLPAENQACIRMEAEKWPKFDER